MTTQVRIDRRALTEFDEYMTTGLRRELERAYSRTLFQLGKGAKEAVQVQMTRMDKANWQLNWAAAGVRFEPSTAGKIQRLDPMRIVVGIREDFIKRARDTSTIPSELRLRDREIFRRAEQKGGKAFLVTLRKTPPVATQARNRPMGYKDWKRSKKAGKVAFVRRVGAERYPLQVLYTVDKKKLRDRPRAWSFQGTVRAYVEANHDKILDKQFRRAVARAGKRL